MLLSNMLLFFGFAKISVIYIKHKYYFSLNFFYNLQYFPDVIASDEKEKPGPSAKSPERTEESYEPEKSKLATTMRVKVEKTDQEVELGELSSSTSDVRVRAEIKKEDESDLFREVSLLNDTLSTPNKAFDSSLILPSPGSNYELATTLELIGEASPEKVPEKELFQQDDANFSFDQSLTDEPVSSTPANKGHIPTGDVSMCDVSMGEPDNDSSSEKSSAEVGPMLSAVGMAAPSNAAVSQQDLEDERAKFAVLMPSSSRLVKRTISLASFRLK